MDPQPPSTHYSWAPVASDVVPNDSCPVDSGPVSSPSVPDAAFTPQEPDQGQTGPTRDAGSDSPEPDQTQSLSPCDGVDSSDQHVPGVELISSIHPEPECLSDPAVCVDEDSTHLRRSRRSNFGMRPLRFRSSFVAYSVS